MNTESEKRGIVFAKNRRTGELCVTHGEKDYTRENIEDYADFIAFVEWPGSTKGQEISALISIWEMAREYHSNALDDLLTSIFEAGISEGKSSSMVCRD